MRDSDIVRRSRTCHSFASLLKRNMAVASASHSFRLYDTCVVRFDTLVNLYFGVLGSMILFSLIFRLRLGGDLKSVHRLLHWDGLHVVCVFTGPVWPTWVQTVTRTVLIAIEWANR